jgi:ribosome maturation factor RimP
MTTDVATRVSELVEPLIAAHGAELYDVVLGGATLQVLVGGGVDLDALADLTREISNALDEDDPMPDRYTLEVSTPGLERTLRTPHHFSGAIGERVKVKTKAGDTRRLDGVVTGADDEGFVVDTGTEQRRLSYDDVERARTVFEWGPTPKKGSAK